MAIAYIESSQAKCLCSYKVIPGYKCLNEREMRAQTRDKRETLCLKVLSEAALMNYDLPTSTMLYSTVLRQQVGVAVLVACAMHI